jgi:hypothetical protein
MYAVKGMGIRRAIETDQRPVPAPPPRVPERGIGVVLLANRSYPIGARVAAAQRIVEAVGR